MKNFQSESKKSGDEFELLACLTEIMMGCEFK